MKSSKTEKNTDTEEDIISKSELKRQMHERQKLGESLIDLPLKKLKSLPIGEELFEAICLTHEMKNDNGRRRQLQRIGKLMRHEDTDAITAELNNTQKQEQQQQSLEKQQTEQAKLIYESLISDDKQAFTEFIQQYPQANRQLLRQLITHVRKENEKRTDNKITKNAIRLIHELRSTIAR